MADRGWENKRRKEHKGKKLERGEGRWEEGLKINEKRALEGRRETLNHINLSCFTVIFTYPRTIARNSIVLLFEEIGVYTQ